MRCSSVVREFACGAIGRQSYFLFQSVFHNCVKKAVVCTFLSGMVHIKEPLLLIRKRWPSSGGSRFPIFLSEWYFTICPTPYNCIKNVLSASLKNHFRLPI